MANLSVARKSRFSMPVAATIGEAASEIEEEADLSAIGEATKTETTETALLVVTSEISLEDASTVERRDT